jgi:hypothetical protein
MNLRKTKTVPFHQFAIFIFIALATLFSCSNDIDASENQTESKTSLQLDVLSENSQDETINNMLYYTSKALSTMENKQQLLGNKYVASEQVYFTDLMGDSKARSTFEERFISEIKDSDYTNLANVASGELVKSISNLLVYNEEQYKLGVSVYKLATKNTAPILIAAGFEVDDHDAIVAFENGKERTLTEKQAKAYKGTILIVQNLPANPISLAEIKKSKEREDLSTVDTSNYATKMSDDDMELGHYILKYPYYFEKRGNLDLKVGFMYNGRSNSNWSTIGLKSYSLNRNVVTNSETQWPVDNVKAVPEDRFIAFDSDYAVFAYEYDWYASTKTVTCSCSCANPSPPPGWHFRAKYSSEYWTNQCGVIRSAWPNVGDYEDMNSHSYKGFFRFWRKQ